MAGDWIKIEKVTPEKPEVLAISEFLGIHPSHAFGLCVKFWIWCDSQLADGNARNVTKVTLDYVIGCENFTQALLKVNWLRDRSGSLEVPHFDRHLSQGAKNRALTKERVSKHKEKSNRKSVSELTEEALAEKRREEKSIKEGDTQRTREDSEEIDPQKETQPPRQEFPSQEKVSIYAQSAPVPIFPDCAIAYFDEMEAVGWIGKNGHPIVDWRAGLRRYASHWNLNEQAKKMKTGKPDHREAKKLNEFTEKFTPLPRLR